MPEPSLAEDAARALAIVREQTLIAPKLHRSFIDDDDEPVEIDYRPPCRYTDVSDVLGHGRAQAALRALEIDGEIVWLASGVLFPNEFPWSQFARRAGPSLARDASDMATVEHARGETAARGGRRRA